MDSISPLKNYLSAVSLPRKRKPETPRPAVTISRESGAGALAVARLVANGLDLNCPGNPPCAWAVFDRNLITQILDDHSLSKKIEEFMPEDARFPLSEAFEYLLGLHPPGWTLREHAKDTIRKLATNGNVILVGRAGAIITADLPNVLHVRLVAPFEFRIKNYAQAQGISEKQAVKAVRANDGASQRYVRSYFNTNVRNQWHYDLVINTASIGFESAARVICTALQDLSLNGRNRLTPGNQAGQSGPADSVS